MDAIEQGDCLSCHGTDQWCQTCGSSGHVKWAVIVHDLKNYWDAAVYETKEAAQGEFIRKKGYWLYDYVALCIVIDESGQLNDRASLGLGQRKGGVRYGS